MLDSITKMLGGDDTEVVRECRRCGTTLDDEADECTHCGPDADVVTYEV